MARGRACWRACEADDIEGCWLRGEGSTRPGDRLVEARVCCTERIVWASADSAAAWMEKISKIIYTVFTSNNSVLDIYDTYTGSF